MSSFENTIPPLNSLSTSTTVGIGSFSLNIAHWHASCPHILTSSLFGLGQCETCNLVDDIQIKELVNLSCDCIF